MNFKSIYTEVARNLSLLGSDDVSITPQGRVTLGGIKIQINLLYQDRIVNYLIERFSLEFEQTTYPLQTYRTNFTVSGSSTGTTLISTIPIFNNSDEGYTIQFVSAGMPITGPNATTAFANCKILQYISNNSVVIDQTVQSAWTGSTAFILGNEFEFNGDAANCKEIISLFYQFQPNSIPIQATLRQKSDMPFFKILGFSQGAPVWYRTTHLVNGQSIRAVGIAPIPTDYRGTIIMNYTRRPASLVNDSDVPQLEISGISNVLINGTTAWGLRILGRKEEAKDYEEEIRLNNVQTREPLGLKEMLKNFVPINRGRPAKLRLSERYISLQRRSI